MSQKIDPAILAKSTELICTCGCKIFQEGYQIREVSKFIIGAAQDAIIPMGVFYCVKCFEVPEKFQSKINP